MNPELFILELWRDGEVDYRIYRTQGRAEAALTIAMKTNNRWSRLTPASGGRIFSTDLSGLTEVERRGTMTNDPAQDPLF